LVTGFVAKEAVISTFAQTYGAQQPSRGHAQTTPLAEQLKASFATSSGGHTTPAVLAFLVFLLAYTPCMTTIATQRAEIGTRWALVGVGLQLGIAWLLAVAVFQIGALVV
jgi:ferrous iron transport protein B